MIKYIYLIQSLEDGYYKIGVSKNPNKRVKQLQTGNSSELKLIETYQSKHANIVEKTIHRQLEHCKKEGEWFDMSLPDALSFKMQCERVEKNIIFLKKSGNVFI